ncbi:hypothetical protein HZA96_05900 [Candidatus Woesearchaeota archaeon]|nr:hypothetical protein [Candidatus Woesearchaeota archaeon]
MKKKAMELAINFIVMLILAMAIFGVGIYFATNIFGKTAKMGDSLDQQTTTLLENKLRDSSLPVAFGKFKQTVKKGDNIKFALGIANNEQGDKTFEIKIECSIVVKNSEEVKLPCPPPPKDKEIIVPAKDYKTSAILFAVDKKTSSATYIYDVIVTEKGAEADESGEVPAYGGLQKLYIEVK